MITALIRTSGRPNQFKRCLDSLKSQTHKDWRVIVIFDKPESLGYIKANVQDACIYQASPAQNQFPYYWNLYCNELMQYVTPQCGWFFFMDDDDYLIDKEALERIAEYLTDPASAVICQFMRGETVKPSGFHISKGIIKKGMIGGGCIFLHHSQKNVAQWDGYQAADYRFIMAVQSRLPVRFAEVVVQQAGNAGLHGKTP